MAIRLITGRLQQRFLDIAGVLADWNRSDMHLTSGVVGVVRVCIARLRVAFLSGVGRLKPS